MIYEPREDSFLLKKELIKIVKGKNVLDMGAGSGILGKSALESGAKKVIFSDISKEAVSLLRKEGLNATQSDLFSKIRGKFDVIVFNPPYLPFDKREDKESALITSGGKKGDEIICKFILQAKRHIEKSGIILLVVSSLTPMVKFNTLCKKMNLKTRILSKQDLAFERIYVLKVYENPFKHNKRI